MKATKKRMLLTAVVMLLTAVQLQAVTHRALLFGLGRQQDASWQRIHGDNDLHYVRQMLQTMGYTDIVSLRNEEATKQAMVDAFRQLAARCRKGDKVYIHYSGHGQLVTDLDGDERLKWNNSHGRWDESWIPYDAYMHYCAEDRGEKHLTDDEVATLLRAIRRKVGASGEIIVVVDACHSGDATSEAATADGDAEEPPVRGISQRFVIPRTGQEPQTETTTDDDWLTISACKPYELCQELGEPKVGKLSFALYEQGADFFLLNRLRMERVLLRFMDAHKGRLPQTPMVSGKK